MIEIEDINKLASKCEDCRKKYEEKSKELQKISHSLNGAINEELTKCEKEAKYYHEKLCKSQSEYSDACKSYVKDKLNSMDEIEREMFLNQYGEDIRMNNWKPVVKALSNYNFH